ncbi:MAG TPA: PilZ domain-containing protein [Bryobacteraceae bacterium]|nr:PilZ domain-containing protein [Bryobacteraceae bacterium]
MSQKGDIRRHSRSPRSGPVQLTWKDANGNAQVSRGRLVDISEAGMRVELPEPLEKLTYLTVRADGLGIHGTASVRSCIRKGLKYVVGLEFSAGLQWKPKD